MAWDDFTQWIPGVNIIDDVANGRWGHAGKNLVTGGLYGPGEKIGEAVQKPYDDKRAGIESIQQRLADLKKERLARMDEVYGKADSKYDDTRAAMKQIYGDPKSWTL